MFVCFFVLSLSLNASATYIEEQNSEPAYVYNEYDQIAFIKNSSQAELSKAGVTPEDANSVIISFNQAVRSRIALSDYCLMGFGYTQEEIETYHQYKDIPVEKIPEEVLRSLSGTCTGHISGTYFSSRKAGFIYSWSWDHAPLIGLKDSAAVGWRPVKSDGAVIDVTKTLSVSYIRYYWYDQLKFQRSGTVQPNLADYNLHSVGFNVTENFQSSTGITEQAYAKTGLIVIRVEVEPEVTSSMVYIKVTGLYGHTIIGVGFPTASLSLGGPSISFSGNLSIDDIAFSRVKITTGPRPENPSVTIIN